MVTEEQAAVLAIAKVTPTSMPQTVELLRACTSAAALLRGEEPGDEDHAAVASRLRELVTSDELEWARRLIADASSANARLVTVLDPDYPKNLHDVHDEPPFLFYSGTLERADRRAIAVVGTRKASAEGLALAHALARDLAAHGVTVVSGLARGIDTAAHEGALEAGGRTLAVFGTGIRQVYPAENRDLAVRITTNGACLSQFWPDSPPTKQTFPRRNVVTSGLALGTVVIEASGTSGASQQARHALRHGRQLFLVESLVLREEWARRIAETPGVHVVTRPDDVLDVIEALLGDGGHLPRDVPPLTLAS